MTTLTREKFVKYDNSAFDCICDHRFHSAIVVLFFFVLSALPASANDRIALVVGNSAYASITPLKNARRDAEAISDKLNALGFDVSELLDADGRSTQRALNRFASKVKTSDIALLYFAGHGIQLFGENFLLPANFDPQNVNQKSELGMQLNSVIRTLRESKAKRLIVIVDACRDNPLDPIVQVQFVKKAARTLGVVEFEAKQTKGIAIGLAPIDSSTISGSSVGFDGETLLMFSAQPGRVALDGEGLHSPFANALVTQLGKSGLNVIDTFLEVSREVTETTDGFQRPEMRTSWSNRGIYFAQNDQNNEFVSYLFNPKLPAIIGNQPAARAIKQFLRGGYLEGSFNGVALLHARMWVEGMKNYSYKRRVEETGFDPLRVGIKAPNAVSYQVDVDGDGLNEKVVIGYGQVGLEYYVEKNGAKHEFWPECPGLASTEGKLDIPEGSDGIEFIETGFFDINSNRLADLWIVTKYEDLINPELCVLEFTGNYRKSQNLSSVGSVSVFDPFTVRPLISDTAGWGVRLLPNRSIEICWGSYCANQSIYYWNGKEFEVLRSGGRTAQKLASLSFSEASRKRWLRDYGISNGSEQLAEKKNVTSHLEEYVSQIYFAEKAQYAPRVDFYSAGLVSEDFVRKEISKQRKRWPSRKYELIPDSLEIIDIDGNEFRLKLQFSYSVRRPGKQASGEAELFLNLISENGKILVRSVKEKLLDK